jgi:hypothetical protein
MALAKFVEYFCKGLAIPDIPINVKDVTVNEVKTNKNSMINRKVPKFQWLNGITK